MQKPQKIRLKAIQKLEQILSVHQCRKTFFRFFYRFIGAGKLFFIIFYRFIYAGKLFIVFFYCFIGEKFFPNRIVSLSSIFFSKIVYRFNQYIFEYRCRSLVTGKLEK
jgi:hypothetical protein